jgi:hypothetical protein
MCPLKFDPLTADNPMTSAPIDSICVTPRARRVTWALMLAGVFGGIKGAGADVWHLQFAWLCGFLFIVYHIFDNAWSSPLRRLLEQLAGASLVAAVFLFIPIVVLRSTLYPWLGAYNPASMHRHWLFIGGSAVCLGLLGIVIHRLLYWSLRQDKSGMARCAHALRAWSVAGAFILAISMTFASMVWMHCIGPRFVSGIYPIWYFSACVWCACAVVFLLSKALEKRIPVIGNTQFHRLGTLIFAFTLFHAYIGFSQYLIVWHAGLPGEMMWYVTRSTGTWKWVAVLLILGHFLIPFLLLLRTQWKLEPRIMVPVCFTVCVMHYVDISFQIMPEAHVNGFPLKHLWIDASCLVFMAGLTAWLFLRFLSRHPAYCLRDPRMAEAMGSHIPPTTLIATAPEQPHEH